MYSVAVSVIYEQINTSQFLYHSIFWNQYNAATLDLTIFPT